MVQDTAFKRHPAVKMIIKSLLTYNFNPGDEQAGSYLERETERIYRFNLMAIIVSKEIRGSITNFFLDDGTGMINLRFFEEEKKIDNLKVGEAILIIGKLRKYNEERYIAAVLVKKINPLWLKVRGLELKEERARTENDSAENPLLIEDIEENSREREQEIKVLPVQKMIQVIKKLDQGEGVFIEEVLENSGLDNSEFILEQMLKKGDIFQNLPGKVKVL